MKEIYGWFVENTEDLIALGLGCSFVLAAVGMGLAIGIDILIRTME